MDSASNYYTWIIQAFAPYIGSRILEVGAGSGTFSRRLLEFRPELLTCLEPSSNCAKLLEENLDGLPAVEARRGCLADHAGSWHQRYDTVVYVNVLEHIEHDRDEVQLALDCLRPGGHLLIFVPALPWLYGTADRMFGHFRRYTKQALTGLFAATDSRVLYCRYWDVFGILPWWVAFVLLRRPVMGRGLVRIYDALVVPIARIVEKLVQPPLGKNILLVAGKSPPSNGSTSS